MICTICETIDYVIQKPLLVITGASGTGKTTLAQQLVGVLHGIFILETDLFWNPYFHQEFEKDRSVDKFLNHWMRVAKNIHYNNLQTVAFSTVIPDQILSQTESKHFTGYHFLALTCNTDTLENRLTSKPGIISNEVISRMNEFNSVLDNYLPKSSKINSYTKLNTTNLSVNETFDEVTKWVVKYGKVTVAPDF